MSRIPSVATLALFGMTVSTPGVEAQTQEEVLRRAFPAPVELQRETAFLSEDDLGRVRALAGPGVEVSDAVVTYYVGRRGADTVGIAYFDAHRVRTLPEVLMIVVTPEGAVGRIEVVRFREPPEYRPPAGWLNTFRDRPLDDDLSLKRGIVGITGATLTSRAVTSAVRRTLAIDRVVRAGPGDRP